MSRRVLSAARLFDGGSFHENAALVIEDGRVAAIEPARDPAPVTLAPGFVDWQVNGGGGRLFNDDPTPEAIAAIAAAHARLGTTTILPTLVTDRPEVAAEARRAVAEALRRGTPGVAGAHYEGPHLGARPGAHDPALIRPMTPADRAALAGAPGATVVTVAPESAAEDDVRALAAAGVTVSLGHTEATHDDALRFFAAGARAVTHLFNAMSPLGHRAPGLAGAALASPEVWCGLIADGLHVHPALLQVARMAKPGRIALVSDAMPTVGWEGDRFTLNGREVRRGPDGLRLADGTLAGADIALADAVRTMVAGAGAGLAEALRMASGAAAEMLGLTDRGHLRPGARADAVALDGDLNVRGVWVGGEEVDIQSGKPA